MHSLEMFCNGGHFLCGFKRSTALQADIDRLTAGSQFEFTQTREKRSRIIEAAPALAGLEAEAGLAIIQLVGKDILSFMSSNTNSPVLPLTFAMRGIFCQSLAYDAKHDDPAS